MIKVYIDENIGFIIAKGLHILESLNSDGFKVLSIKKVFGQGHKMRMGYQKLEQSKV